MNRNLQMARQLADKTQAQVAKEVGVTEQMYQRYEYGKAEPSVSKAIQIALVLGRTTEELFGDKL